MRMILALALGVGLAAPAWADIGSDYAAAASIFVQTDAAQVLEGLDGEWLPLSALANGTPDAALVSSLVERFCNADPARGSTIAATGANSFTLTSAGARPVAYRFDWLSGSQFSRSVDPDALFSGLGLDAMDGKAGDDARARALEQAVQTVSLYRTSPDILVVASPQQTEILGRCPDSGA